MLLAQVDISTVVEATGLSFAFSFMITAGAVIMANIVIGYISYRIIMWALGYIRHVMIGFNVGVVKGTLGTEPIRSSFPAGSGGGYSGKKRK